MRSIDNQSGWDERVASSYEATSKERYDPELLATTAAFLKHRADGTALELAIGTGRVALPLSALGVQVAGIDTSVAMLAELATRPGAEAIEVIRGDMAHDVVPGEFGLVYLVYNTITNLLTQDEQVACFANAARHLTSGGRFVIETFVPDLRLLPPGQSAVPFTVTEEHLGFDTYDLVNQLLVSHHHYADAGAFTSPHRYVWPSELDLMARLAGLQLVERYADWDESPFTHDSRSHVSVWQKSAN